MAVLAHHPRPRRERSLAPRLRHALVMALLYALLVLFEIYITPSPEDARAVCEAGADIVAFDATLRPREVSVAVTIAATHARGKLALADIATVAEAAAALHAGADMVSTTFSGYTADSPVLEGPDLVLIGTLAAGGVRVLAEKLAAIAVLLGVTRVTLGGSVGLRPGYRVRDGLHHLPEVYRLELVCAKLGADARLARGHEP